MQKTRRLSILLLALCLMLQMLPVGAFEFEVPEMAVETTNTEIGAALAESTIDISLVDDKYGDLVWYSNFDSSDDYLTPTYVLEGSGIRAEAVATQSVRVVADPTPTGAENKCIELVADGWYSAVQLNALQYAQPGTYTLVVDLYFSDGTPTPGVLGRGEKLAGGGDAWQGPWEPYATQTGVWQTYAWSLSASAAEQGLKVIAARRFINDSTPYYYDNLRLYCKPTPGENQLFLSDGTHRQIITFDEETTSYTFPTKFLDNTISDWTDGETFWTAGSTVETTAVAKKTVYPCIYQPAPAEYHETYGQLVFFDNFSPSNPFKNLTNIQVASYMPDRVRYKNYLSVRSGHVNTASAGNRLETYGFEVEPAASDDYFCYLDKAKTPLSGKVTFYADLYSPDTERTYWSAVSKRSANFYESEADKDWTAWGGGV